jgi:hypothetical protein
MLFLGNIAQLLIVINYRNISVGFVLLAFNAGYIVAKIDTTMDIETINNTSEMMIFAGKFDKK